MFTEKDLQQIAAHGLTPEAVEHQIENFRRGFPFLNVKAAASPDNGGVKRLSEAEAAEYQESLFGNDGELMKQRVELIQLVLDLLSFHTGKTSESHLDDCLSLNFGKTVSFAKSRFRIGDRLRGLHKLNDLVDIVDSDRVALEYMSARKSAVELVLSSSCNNALLMRDIVVDNTYKRKDLRHAVNEREHIDRAGVLELAVLIKLL